MEFIRTKDELDILRAVYEHRIIAKDTAEAQSQLIDLLGKWKVYVGLSKDTNPQELIINSTFIIEKFPNITVAEISLAVDLYILGKLSGDIKHYGSFSMLYICDVINSYLEYRKITLAEFVKKRDLYKFQEEQKEKIMTPEEDMQLTKEILIDFYKKYQETGTVDDILNICYKFISKNKLMVFTEQLISDALEYGKKQFIADVAKSNQSFNRYVKEYVLSQEEQEKVYSRNYCTSVFFQNNTSDEILGMININQFINQ